MSPRLMLPTSFVKVKVEKMEAAKAARETEMRARQKQRVDNDKLKWVLAEVNCT